MQSRIGKDKRGISLLLEIILGVIIAIPLVILLFYLGSSVISLFFSPQQPILQAAGQLEQIVEAINYGEEFLLLSPQGWFFVSLAKNTINEKVIVPAECEGENCVCICPPQSRGEWFKLNFRKVDCSKKGQCEVLEKPLLEKGLLIYRDITLSKFNVSEEENFYRLEEIES